METHFPFIGVSFLTSIMEVKEFRIGNLVIYNGMIMRISEICSPKPLKDKRYSDKYIIELFDGAGLISCTLDDIEPIAITEEYLLKFGYWKLDYKDSHFVIKGHVIWKCNDLFMCEKNGIILKHVHQHQNLYFALTQTELIISEKI